MRRRAPLLMVVAVAAASTLAGCGGSSDPKQSVLAAATLTASQSASAKLTLEGSTAFGAAHLLVVTRAAFAFPTRIGYERVDLPPAQKPRKAYLVFLPNKVLLAPILAGGAALPEGASWVSASLTGPGFVAQTAFPRFVAQVEGLNAQLLLDEILWGTTSASLVGEPVINHVPLSEYSVSIDLKRVLSKRTGATGRRHESGRRAATRRPRRSPVRRRISVWIDGPGRIVMLRAAFPGSGLGTVTMVLYGFGVKFRDEPTGGVVHRSGHGYRPAVRRRGLAMDRGRRLRLVQADLPHQLRSVLVVAQRSDAERGVRDGVERRKSAVRRDTRPDRILEVVAPGDDLLTRFADEEADELLGLLGMVARREHGRAGDVRGRPGVAIWKVVERAVHAFLSRARAGGDTSSTG